jgi:hypothetical protein
MKECKKCNETKPLTEYYTKTDKKYNKTYYHSYCKPCWLKRNSDNRRKKIATDPEYAKKHSQQYKDWYKRNKRAKLDYNNAYSAKRRKEDPIYKMRVRVANGVKAGIKDGAGKQRASTWDHLPYTPEELRLHLESQWEDWMNWDNYGNDAGCWVIDHIYPQAKLPFDSLDHPNFLKCWGLDNLRPLCRDENLLKSDKILDF